MMHFRTYELVDKGTYEKHGDDCLSLFNPELLLALDDLREFFGVPVTVNNWHDGGPFQWRGYRTSEMAYKLGAPHSQHAMGNAIDCDISGYTAERARKIIIENKNDRLLKRIMRLEDGVNWVHFDLLKAMRDRIHLFRAKK